MIEKIDEFLLGFLSNIQGCISVYFTLWKYKLLVPGGRVWMN